MDLRRLKEIADQAGQQNGCRLYDFYRHRDRLQFLIDKPSHDVSLKDCENVLHSLQFLIRSEFPEILDQKKIEVSSPGIEKRLRETWHFREVLGETIKVITLSPVKATLNEQEKLNEQAESRQRFCQSVTAELTSVDSNKIILKEGYLEWHIPADTIKTANVVFLLPKKTKQVKRTKKLKKNKQKGRGKL